MNEGPHLFRWAVLLALAAAAAAACAKRAPGESGDVAPIPAADLSGAGPPFRYTYQVVHAWHHDPNAFTQGLVYRDGELLESTGLNGLSSLREVALDSGRVLRQVSVPVEYFAEGLAVLGTHAYQLTWQNQKGFIYDLASFRREGEFSFEGEGWGLASDGHSLVLSDGTSRIRFLNPTTFRVERTLDVTLSGRPLDRLNELEWVRGEIFANVWQTDEVVRIDPSNGIVRGIIDFSFLLPLGDRGPQTDVLNGIAFDPAEGRLFVTGKRWPKMFEVRLIAQPAAHP